MFLCMIYVQSDLMWMETFHSRSINVYQILSSALGEWDSPDAAIYLKVCESVSVIGV